MKTTARIQKRGIIQLPSMIRFLLKADIYDTIEFEHRPTGEIIIRKSKEILENKMGTKTI